MKIFRLVRGFARRFDAKAAYESYKAGFKEKENEHLKNDDYFKDYEEVIESNTVHNTRGMLTICPTPIGNLRDISIRQYQALKSADILACEDTRLTGLLLKLLGKLSFAESESLEFPPASPPTPELDGIDEYSLCLGSEFMSHTFQTIKSTKESKGRGIMVSFNAYNQEHRTPKLITAMKSGIRIVLVSDAGTPLVSDPGFSLVQAAIRNGVSIESLPGPVAAITALTISGFPTENFFFAGYMPKIASEKIAKLVKMQESGSSCIVYESSHRIINTLEKICEVFGELHPVFVAQELTKMYEQQYRGTCKEVLERFNRENEVKGKIYGELTLVVSPVMQEKNKLVAEVDVEHMMKVLHKYLKMTPMELGKIGYYVSGWNQRKLTRMVEKYVISLNTKKEDQEEEEDP